MTHSDDFYFYEGVEDVLFEDLVSTSESGIRISAELLRGGFVRNVTFRNLTFDWSNLLKKTFLFEVEQNYPNGGTNPPCAGCPVRMTHTDINKHAHMLERGHCWVVLLHRCLNRNG